MLRLRRCCCCAQTVVLHLEVVDEHIASTFDIIGVFVLICIVKEHEAIMAIAARCVVHPLFPSACPLILPARPPSPLPPLPPAAPGLHTHPHTRTAAHMALPHHAPAGARHCPRAWFRPSQAPLVPALLPPAGSTLAACQLR